MKNPTAITLTFLGWLLLFQTISAQTINRNSWTGGLTSGIAAMGGNKTYDAKGYYQAGLSLGYFPVTDFGFGLELDISNISLNDGPYPAFGLGPFIRFYLGKNFYSHANFEVGFVGDDLYDYSKITFNLGYDLFLGQSFALEPKLFYVFHNESGRTFDFNGPGIGIGIQSFSKRY